MELEKAVELLKEMQENCKSKKLYKDEKAEAKAEAIEVVLKKLEERIGLETERDVLRSEVSALKADKKYFKKESEKKDKVLDEMAKMSSLIC